MKASEMGAPRKLVQVDKDIQCKSVDHEHPHIQCVKAQDHPMNWHEAPDPGGAVIHTWIDKMLTLESI